MNVKQITLEELKNYKYISKFNATCSNSLNQIIVVADGNIYMLVNSHSNKIFSVDFNSVELYNEIISVTRKQREKIKQDIIKKTEEQEKIKLQQIAEKKKAEELRIKKEKQEERKKNFVPNCVDRAFDLSVINLDCNYPIEKIIDGILNFADQIKRDNNKVKSCCVLLSGNSGTGKTEFAKYVSSLTGLKFKHIRASDILNKYVCGTEQNISTLFKECSNNKTILIIDEADSLLRDRQLSKNSWEVTQVNEFLCRMEEFNGILICSSNLINDFDKAAMRRFIFKIKFLDLTEQGKITLAKKYFDEVCLLPSDLTQINRINDLRPGDFKAVRDRMLIVYRDKISFEEILNELKLETSYRCLENLKVTL